VHELLLSAMHDCLSVVVTNGRTRGLTPVLGGLHVCLSVCRLVLHLGYGAATLIERSRIQRLFHHLGLPSLFDHVAIKLIASLLLLVRQVLPGRPRRTIGRAASNFLTHV